MKDEYEGHAQKYRKILTGRQELRPHRLEVDTVWWDEIISPEEREVATKTRHFSIGSGCSNLNIYKTMLKAMQPIYTYYNLSG